MKVDYMKPSGWKKVKVTDNTHITLKNGKRVPSWKMMERLAAKIK